MKNRIIDTDVLIIGGGTAGCFAGITLGGKKDLDVLIVEKRLREVYGRINYSYSE